MSFEEAHSLTEIVKGLIRDTLKNTVVTIHTEPVDRDRSVSGSPSELKMD